MDKTIVAAFLTHGVYEHR